MPFIKLGAGQITAVRLVSLVSGLVTMVFVGLIGRHVAGPRVGIAAAALCLVVPFFVVENSIGLEEPLAVAALTAALYFQIRVAETPRLDLALPMGLAMALAVFTKETGRFSVVLLPFSLLLFDWRARERARRLAAWFGCAALALTMTYALYSVMRLSPLWDQFVEFRRSGPYPVRSLGEALDDPVAVFNSNWPSFRAALHGYITLPLILAFAVGAGLLFRSRPREAGLLAVWFASLLASAVFFPFDAFPRYVFYVLPPMVIFAAFALAQISPEAIRPASWLRGLRLHRLSEARVVRALEGDGRRPRRMRQAVAALALLLICLPALRFDADVLDDPDTARYPGLDDNQYVTGPSAGTEWPTVVHELERLTEGRTVPTFVLVYGLARRSLAPFAPADGRLRFVGGGTPEGDRAEFIVQNGGPPPDIRSLELVRQFPRPRGGVLVRLLRRSK